MTNKSTGSGGVRVRLGVVARNLSKARVVAAGCGLVLALAAGCASGQYTYVTTTGTGQRLEFPLERGQPVHVKKGTIQILHAGLLPPPDPNLQKAAFAFAFSEESGVAPKSVVVEDVSDREIHLLVDDQEPKLTDQQWRGMSEFYNGEAAALGWLRQLGDTMRVFRFTIEKDNGEKVIVHQAWSAPGWMKTSMRRALGLPAL